MTTGLVGSEMCIRDRPPGPPEPAPVGQLRLRGADAVPERGTRRFKGQSAIPPCPLAASTSQAAAGGRESGARRACLAHRLHVHSCPASLLTVRPVSHRLHVHSCPASRLTVRPISPSESSRGPKVIQPDGRLQTAAERTRKRNRLASRIRKIPLAKRTQETSTEETQKSLG